MECLVEVKGLRVRLSETARIAVRVLVNEFHFFSPTLGDTNNFRF